MGELTTAAATQEAPSLHHKNLQPVTYVTGDLAGRNGSPAYAILQVNQRIAELALPDGNGLETAPVETAA